MSIQSVVPTSSMLSPMQFESSLTPDALMVYLSTRLTGLDDQINAIFNTQQAQEKVQSALRKMQAAIANLDDHSDPNTLLTMPDLQDNGTGAATTTTAGTPPDPNAPNTPAVAGTSQNEKDVNSAIAELRQVDPALADTINNKLNEKGFVMWVQDGKYFSNEVTATNEYLKGLSKDVEADSQMNMIRLQSLMSSRQTAIQLATNLISALGESSKAIASNIGR
jgi:hypothetical protein